MVCRDRPARSSPIGNRSRFDIARAGNILVPDRSARDSGVGAGQAGDSAGGRHRKIERRPCQSCSGGVLLQALPMQAVSSRQALLGVIPRHFSQRLTAPANCVPMRSAVAARCSEVLISSVGCQNESISAPHLRSALELCSQHAAIAGSCCPNFSDLSEVNRASAKTIFLRPALSTSASSANLASVPSPTSTLA